jgi:hypothetical protein
MFSGLRAFTSTTRRRSDSNEPGKSLILRHAGTVR